jgi:hypothetical protein
MEQEARLIGGMVMDRRGRSSLAEQVDQNRSSVNLTFNPQSKETNKWKTGKRVKNNHLA